jgi:hypothetical protein
MFSFVVFAVSVDKGSKKMVIANFQCIYYWCKVGYMCYGIHNISSHAVMRVMVRPRR